MLYTFGPFSVDDARCRLLRDGTPLAVTPKAFDLLLILVRNPNRVLSKRELISALWPDSFVHDANLTQHMFMLRKALAGTCIETVPRRGYVFAADVRATDAPARDPDSAQTVAVDAARKHATVMSCVVSNASAIAERFGPARFDAVMADLVTVATAEVERFEGIIRRTRPDGFEAIFGARVVHEDDALRAAVTALCVTRAADPVPDAAHDDDAAIVRIGIASGPVVVTRRARTDGVDYSAIGDAVENAERLYQAAEPGTILIDHATAGSLEGCVAVEQTAIVVGHAPAFHVARDARVRSVRSPRLMRTLTPFVGRVHEFGLLANAAMHVRGGRGQIVAVVGEAGIGKSRLLLEFAGAMSDLTVLEARCLSFGSFAPYLPIADLVRAFCRVSDGAPADDIARAVQSAVADIGGEGMTSLLRLLGVADADSGHVSPEAVRAGIFAAVRALLLHASARNPVLIIVEDVHWIDRSSEEFLAMLVDRIAGERILMVVTSRPGWPMPWRDRSFVSQITLTALAADDSGTLVESVAGPTALSASASAEILSKGDGNPLFLEELTRAVLDRGSGDRVPDTVHGVIMARIDRLPDLAKHLLQTAAVIGRDVPLRLLTRIWREAPPIGPLVEQLCRLEFLYETSGGGETVFIFRHALVQDVAYDSLLASRRRDLHVAAARALEHLHEGRLDEVTSALAYHYGRTDLVEEAIAWLIRAADRAAHVYANAEAILHLNVARRRIERMPPGVGRDRVEVEVAMKHAHSLYFLGRWRESVETLLPYTATVARVDDPALTAAYAFWLAHMYTRLGDQRRTAEHARRAIDAGERAGHLAVVGKAHGVIALDSHWSGDVQAGIAHGLEAVRILSADADQRWWLGMAHFYIAMNHLVAGTFDAALAEAAQADGIGEDIGDPRLQTYAGFLTAWVEASRGNCEKALAVCRRSHQLAPDRVSRAFASMILGFALLQAGDHRGARQQAEPLVAEFECFGFPQWQAWASTIAAETHRLDGALDAAGALAARGLKLAVQSRYWYAVGFGERVAARIAVDSGRPADAARAFERAADTFARIGARFEETRTRDEARRAVPADRLVRDAQSADMSRLV